MKILVSIFLLFAVVLTAACPSKTIEKAKASSAKLASYANTGVNLTRDLYREGGIDLATKDRIADGFIALANAGATFDAAIRAVEEAYGTDVPRSEVQRLFLVFNEEVVSRFLDILKELKLISDAAAYAAVIDAIRAAVLAIAVAFDRGEQVEGRLQTV